MRIWKILGGAWEEEMPSRERVGSEQGPSGRGEKDLPQFPSAR